MHVITDLLTSNVRTRPEAPALLSAAGRVSYRELFVEAHGRSRSLARIGVAKGDRVAIFQARGHAALASFFGIQLLGGVAVFLGDGVRRAQIDHILRDSQPRAVVVDDRQRHLLPSTLPSDAVLALGPDEASDDASSADPAAAPPVIGRDLAVLLYTSGSTGGPKGVMVTHENLVSGAQIVADYLGLCPADRALGLLPWNFDYGLNQVLATFHAGGCVVPQNSSFAPDICRSIADYAVTGLAGVPAIWSLLLRRPSPFLHMELPSLRYITNSGGPLSSMTIDLLQRHHPNTEIVAMYGLTEAFRSSYLPPAELHLRPGSMGRAIPNTELLVVGADGHRCGPGELGELVHSGPTVAAGYWRQPEATTKVFRPHPFPPPGAVPQVVVYSGDNVTTDEQGYLYYVGRGDELFKSRGIRTNPGEIEAGLLASGLATEIIVRPLPAEDSEPLIIAAVIPIGSDIEDSSLASRLDAHARATLTPHLRPHHYMIVREPPRTDSGKTDRMTVRRMMVARFGTDQPL
ncbi:AMP-binding protein [Pseudonocardia broussonetiae]|uniref:AMP-binding protein n=1 Tax=Pseudonocardia broussonetiae TaxID=2736640 RepID=A0A6M6JCP2_9PSEU|nr:AMP-binding protein [Pseudonocardia broussonetiae]QJY45728.1 AMP-binding protein [Pseudonocardia broussonetiae]